jgi:hypothetical protein
MTAQIQTLAYRSDNDFSNRKNVAYFTLYFEFCMTAWQRKYIYLSGFGPEYGENTFLGRLLPLSRLHVNGPQEQQSSQ